VSSYDGFVRLFDPLTGKRTAQWVPARSEFLAPSPHYFLLFKGDGSELLSGFWHSGLKALDPATAKVIRQSDTYNSGAWYAYGPGGCLARRLAANAAAHDLIVGSSGRVPGIPDARRRPDHRL
jgi:hypothetical protein